jgi:DNA-binding IclR family transcriptional regulator
LLNLLVADGYLVRIADLSGFALGRRTRELAGAVPEATPGFRPAGAVVEELRARVRFGIFVASYADGRVRLVDRDPDHELTSESAIRTHLHASAIGKLLLAQRPELAPAPLRAVTACTITRADALTAELSTIRASDVREVDELRWGRSALAVPVRDRSRAVVGCLVAIGRTGRIGVEDADLAQLLRRYADRAVSPG